MGRQLSATLLASVSAGDALAFRNLRKSFAGAVALDGVSLTVRRHEVHGLLGQNGSGKSTLIKILSGFHAPDPGGELELFGQNVPLPIPAGESKRLGIAFVHQHLGMLPSLSVLENLRIGDFATEARLRIDWRAERVKAEALFARFGLDIDPMARVETLAPVERALLAIVRAFEDLGQSETGHGILVLDEPTPFLPKRDVDRLFALVTDIVAAGASVILVSHDIDEVLAITDRATVLSDGRVAGSVVTAQTRRETLVELIVGRKLDAYRMERKLVPAAAATIRVEGLTGADIQDLSFDVRAGEIVGLTGLIGSGYASVPYLLFGEPRAAAGTLAIGADRIAIASLHPARAQDHGIAMMPGDRLGMGGVGGLSIIDNITLPVLAAFRDPLGLNRRGMARVAGDLSTQHDVRPNRPALPLEALSGGNQQKVLLAKWLHTKPRLLLLDEPTQGVDFGARQQIFAALDTAAQAGTALVVASTDYEQLEQICDRVLVFSRGRVVAELSGADLTKHRIARECYDSGEREAATEKTMATTHAIAARPGRSGFSWKLELERFGLVIAWAVLIAMFGALQPEGFLNWVNFTSMFGSQAVLVVLTLGLLIPLTAGDFDVSIASTMTLSTMTIAVLNALHGWPVGVTIAIVLAVGALIGALNAFLILYFRIHSLIVTLGVGTFINGVVLWVSNSQTISGVSDNLVYWVISFRVFGIPLAFYDALLLAALMWYFMEYTTFGRRLLFIGRGRDVARLNGIRVDRIRTISLMASGMISALAGVLYAGMTGSADPLSGLTLLLPAFAAAFLGATSIVPGRFNPFGAMLSVYFLVTGITGLTMMGVDSYVQNLFYGGGLVVAVALSQLVRNRQPQNFS